MEALVIRLVDLENKPVFHTSDRGSTAGWELVRRIREQVKSNPVAEGEKLTFIVDWNYSSSMDSDYPRSLMDVVHRYMRRRRPAVDLVFAVASPTARQRLERLAEDIAIAVRFARTPAAATS